MASFLRFLVGEPTKSGDVNLSSPRAQLSLLLLTAATASFLEDNSDSEVAMLSDDDEEVGSLPE